MDNSLINMEDVLGDFYGEQSLFSGFGELAFARKNPGCDCPVIEGVWG